MAHQPVSVANFTRRKTDFLIIAGIATLMAIAGERIMPGRTPPAELSELWNQRMFTMIGQMLGVPHQTLLGSVLLWVNCYLQTFLGLFVSTYVLWLVICLIQPSVPKTHMLSQAKKAGMNFCLLPCYQATWELLTLYGYTKTRGPGHRCDLPTIVLDIALWIVAFELAWYTQHRLMHDNKFLWEHGHAYHHSWKKPEHMIGITNFAFDHVVETWVTMSSAFLPILIFPSHYLTSKLFSVCYSILAIFVHWDAFHPFSAYHLNHHYLVVKNYGSHIPIFDILFGTYQWELFVPKGRDTGSVAVKAE